MSLKWSLENRTKDSQKIRLLRVLMTEISLLCRYHWKSEYDFNKGEIQPKDRVNLGITLITDKKKIVKILLKQNY